MNRAQRMHRTLTDFYGSDARLEITDDSRRHAGHVERAVGIAPRDAMETHFSILIESPRFEGMSRLARHRQVNELLRPELDRGLHALKLILRASGEGASQDAGKG